MTFDDIVLSTLIGLAIWLIPEWDRNKEE